MKQDNIAENLYQNPDNINIEQEEENEQKQK